MNVVEPAHVHIGPARKIKGIRPDHTRIFQSWIDVPGLPLLTRISTPWRITTIQMTESLVRRHLTCERPHEAKVHAISDVLEVLGDRMHKGIVCLPSSAHTHFSRWTEGCRLNQVRVS